MSLGRLFVKLPWPTLAPVAKSCRRRHPTPAELKMSINNHQRTRTGTLVNQHGLAFGQSCPMTCWWQQYSKCSRCSGALLPQEMAHSPHQPKNMNVACYLPVAGSLMPDSSRIRSSSKRPPMTEERGFGNLALATPSAQLFNDTWMMMLRQLVVELWSFGELVGWARDGEQSPRARSCPAK